MPEPVRKALARFWELIDSESVRAFVWPYYLAFLTWGIYGTFFAAPVTIVYPVMGPLMYNLWIWSCIAGPAAVMLGLMLGPIIGLAGHREEGVYAGLLMQVFGNAGVALVLFAFEFSGIYGAYWGLAAFSLFIIPPYVLGCVTLTLQAARKVWRIEMLQRELSDPP
jgi:hypothetical protein